MAYRMIPALAALCLTLPLVSCGGGGGDPGSLTNDGYAALGSGDHAGALASFEKALAGLDANAPEYLRAKMGEIEALTHLDADRAKDALLGMGDQAGESEYVKVAGSLTSERHFVQAIDVLDAGIKKYSESPKLNALLEKVKAEAEKGDPAALEKLKGLGYL